MGIYGIIEKKMETTFWGFGFRVMEFRASVEQ